MNTLELLELYLAGRLPKDVTLESVPIRLTAYGDYQIVNRHGQFSPPPDDFEGQSETIRLEMHKVDNQTIFAGYGPQSKRLVIGVEE